MLVEACKSYQPAHDPICVWISSEIYNMKLVFLFCHDASCTWILISPLKGTFIRAKQSQKNRKTSPYGDVSQSNDQIIFSGGRFWFRQDHGSKKCISTLMISAKKQSTVHYFCRTGKQGKLCLLCLSSCHNLDLDGVDWSVSLAEA